MRAISLWQPWATLIQLGVKRYETRSWATDYRGELVIHAAKHCDSECSQYFYMNFRDIFEKVGIKRHSELPFGAAICFCVLEDCIPTEQALKVIGSDERSYGNYSSGRYAWKLTNVQPFDAPVPYKGAQGFFFYDYAKHS